MLPSIFYRMVATSAQFIFKVMPPNDLFDIAYGPADNTTFARRFCAEQLQKPYVGRQQS